MKKSSKEKIDEVLGIKSGLSIDDFLDGLSVDSTEVKLQFELIDDKVKSKIEEIDNQAANIQKSEDGSIQQKLALDSIESSLKEVEDLILTSKLIFKHIYDSIMTTDLIDSELVGAVSKLLESIHINIAEFIELYKDRAKYAEKIKLMIFLQLQKKELMLLKHELELKKLQQKLDNSSQDTENTVSYSVEEVTRMLND